MPSRALLIATYAIFERIATPEERAERDALLGGTPKQGATARVLAARDRLGTLPDAALASELGVSTDTVNRQRVLFGIPSFRTSSKTTTAPRSTRRTLPYSPPAWLATIRDRLGTVPDAVLAREVGVSKERVGQVRDRMGIPAIPQGSAAIVRLTAMEDDRLVRQAEQDAIDEAKENE